MRDQENRRKQKTDMKGKHQHRHETDKSASYAFRTEKAIEEYGPERTFDAVGHIDRIGYPVQFPVQSSDVENHPCNDADKENREMPAMPVVRLQSHTWDDSFFKLTCCGDVRFHARRLIRIAFGQKEPETGYGAKGNHHQDSR